MRGELPTLYHISEAPEGMIRDYCFVKDVASANFLAAQLTAGNFNIATVQHNHHWRSMPNNPDPAQQGF